MNSLSKPPVQSAVSYSKDIACMMLICNYVTVLCPCCICVNGSNSIAAVCSGPASSFLVISDPAAAKHVLRASDNPKNPIYDKGLVAEVCTVLHGIYTDRTYYPT